jgi:hypothetical protein
LSAVPVSERIYGRAALARADVDDAKRGHPAIDLERFAVARGLQYLGHKNASGYFAALPLEEPLQHNVVRGALGDRDVCFWHWRYAWPVDDDGGLGSRGFHGVRINPPLKRLFSAPRRFLSSNEDDHYFVGVPCSAAATLVPEAALLPDFTLGPDLMTRADVPAAVLDSLRGGPVAEVLRAGGARHPLFELRCRFGTLSLRRNGYASEAEAEELLEAVRVAGDALAGACAPLHDPRPFSEPLPEGGQPSPLQELVETAARERGLVPEDPRAYHRAFPRNPVPGTAFAVLRGDGMRIALHTELPVARVNSGRTALLLPAGRAAPTPAGGVPVAHEGDSMRFAVRDGIFAVWILRWRPRDLGDLDVLLARGAEVAREAGAA